AAPAPVKVIAARAPAPAAQAATRRGATNEPLRPIGVKTIKVKLANVHTASLAPSAAMIPVTEEPAPPRTAAAASRDTPAEALSYAPKDTAKETAKTVAPVAQMPAPVRADESWQKTEPARTSWPAHVTPVVAQAAPAAATPAVLAEKTETPPVRSAQPHTGWIIQVGAFDDPEEAKQRLDAAQSVARRLLGRADAFTETVTRGDRTLYRARFAGLDQEQAEAACKYLKRNDIACMTLKN